MEDRLRGGVIGVMAGTITRAYSASRFGQIHYRIAVPEDAPSNPPLLCLHQSPGNGHEWDALQRLLARDRVVIAPDTPGYGMSDAPPQPATIPELADAMFSLIDDLVDQGTLPSCSVDVLGMHTGSVIAANMATLNAARIRKLVLYSLPAFPAAKRAAMLARIATDFPAPDMTLGHVERLWSFFNQVADPRMTAEDRHIAMAECLRAGSRMSWGFQSVFAHDFEHDLRELRQPVLVLNPEDDLHEITSRALPHCLQAECWVLPGRSHGFLTYEGEAVAERLRAFLA